MSKNKRPNIEKVVSIIIVGLIACFFCVEMFCKLPSGEDLLQATCKAEHAGLSGYIDCVLAGWKNIPRIGEAYQHAVIPFFHNLPNFGLETLFRLIDVFLCVGIIYLIVYLTKGRQPEFSYKDSTLAALATFFLATSSFTQLFFKGFSNVHNYLIAVFFTLLFIKLWFFAPKRTKVMPVMCLIVGALAYFICPFDLTPDTLPIIGFLDDLAILTTAIHAVQVCITSQVKDKAKSKLGDWFDKVDEAEVA